MRVDTGQYFKSKLSAIGSEVKPTDSMPEVRSVRRTDTGIQFLTFYINSCFTGFISSVGDFYLC